MAERERTWPWWIGFGVVSATALWFTWRAYHDDVPQLFRAYDKAVHFSFAGGLAFFLHRATARRSPWPVIGLLVIIGIEEIAQRASIHRTSSIYDYAADVAGVIVFTLLARLSARLSKSAGAKPADDVAE
jgi:hypothetical protein